MFYPLVGEQVWVFGCRDEYIVERTDYTACMAAISLVSDRASVLERVSFRLLFAHFEFEAAVAGVAVRPAVEDVLRSSRLCVRQSSVFIRDLRETTLATLAAIRKSQALISETDRDITRWKEFGYAREQEKHAIAWNNELTITR